MEKKEKWNSKLHHRENWNYKTCRFLTLLCFFPHSTETFRRVAWSSEKDSPNQRKQKRFHSTHKASRLYLSLAAKEKTLNRIHCTSWECEWARDEMRSQKSTNLNFHSATMWSRCRSSPPGITFVLSWAETICVSNYSIKYFAAVSFSASLNNDF